MEEKVKRTEKEIARYEKNAEATQKLV